MIASLARNVLAGFIVLALVAPVWAMSSSQIIKAQEALKEKGDNPGPADGIMGKKTRAALEAFQKANGLKATGTLDDKTAEKLGVQKP
ncbi:MAG TPA: peptidoglycan-binding domain-containing protein [Methylomirabilota bacterium]|nr:peptidoglycan-binding domain-containing protein [Methylomirabilota bacterium]